MATWMTFHRDFDYPVPDHGGRVTIAYKAGTKEYIPEAHAVAAEEAKVGERTTKDEDGSQAG